MGKEPEEAPVSRQAWFAVEQASYPLKPLTPQQAIDCFDIIKDSLDSSARGHRAHQFCTQYLLDPLLAPRSETTNSPRYANLDKQREHFTAQVASKKRIWATLAKRTLAWERMIRLERKQLGQDPFAPIPPPPPIPPAFLQLAPAAPTVAVALVIAKPSPPVAPVVTSRIAVHPALASFVAPGPRGKAFRGGEELGEGGDNEEDDMIIRSTIDIETGFEVAEGLLSSYATSPVPAPPFVVPTSRANALDILASQTARYAIARSALKDEQKAKEMGLRVWDTMLKSLSDEKVALWTNLRHLSDPIEAIHHFNLAPNSPSILAPHLALIYVKYFSVKRAGVQSVAACTYANAKKRATSILQLIDLPISADLLNFLQSQGFTPSPRPGGEVTITHVGLTGHLPGRKELEEAELLNEEVHRPLVMLAREEDRCAASLAGARGNGDVASPYTYIGLLDCTVGNTLSPFDAQQLQHDSELAVASGFDGATGTNTKTPGIDKHHEFHKDQHLHPSEILPLLAGLKAEYQHAYSPTSSSDLLIAPPISNIPSRATSTSASDPPPLASTSALPPRPISASPSTQPPHSTPTSASALLPPPISPSALLHQTSSSVPLTSPDSSLSDYRYDLLYLFSSKGVYNGDTHLTCTLNGVAFVIATKRYLGNSIKFFDSFEEAKDEPGVHIGMGDLTNDSKKLGVPYFHPPVKSKEWFEQTYLKGRDPSRPLIVIPVCPDAIPMFELLSGRKDGQVGYEMSAGLFAFAPVDFPEQIVHVFIAPYLNSKLRFLVDRAPIQASTTATVAGALELGPLLVRRWRDVESVAERLVVSKEILRDQSEVVGGLVRYSQYAYAWWSTLVNDSPRSSSSFDVYASVRRQGYDVEAGDYETVRILASAGFNPSSPPLPIFIRSPLPSSSSVNNRILIDSYDQSFKLKIQVGSTSQRSLLLSDLFVLIRIENKVVKVRSIGTLSKDRKQASDKSYNFRAELLSPVRSSLFARWDWEKEGVDTRTEIEVKLALDPLLNLLTLVSASDPMDRLTDSNRSLVTINARPEAIQCIDVTYQPLVPLTAVKTGPLKPDEMALVRRLMISGDAESLHDRKKIASDLNRTFHQGRTWIAKERTRQASDVAMDSVDEAEEEPLVGKGKGKAKQATSPTRPKSTFIGVFPPARISSSSYNVNAPSTSASTAAPPTPMPNPPPASTPSSSSSTVLTPAILALRAISEKAKRMAVLRELIEEKKAELKSANARLEGLKKVEKKLEKEDEALNYAFKVMGINFEDYEEAKMEVEE